MRSLLLASVLASPAGGCALLPGFGALLTDRECMTRAMYFESNRSSPDGMMAVGTTVMNRVAAPGFPKSVCAVVGQPGQYANGVLTKSMNARESARIADVADAVLAGARHPQVGGAMYFHTAGLTFPYTNMHYVAVAGGNAFYEKRAPSSQSAASSKYHPMIAPWCAPRSDDQSADLDKLVARILTTATAVP